jgi:hypothetical protein
LEAHSRGSKTGAADFFGMNVNTIRINFRLGLLVLVAGFLCGPVCAADTCFEARLIWGTNDPETKDPDLKECDPKLVERLKKIFKWKHYHKVNAIEFCVPQGGSKRIALSEKCEISVRDLNQPMVEVKLYGEGKLVKRITQAAIECLVIAGDDKNDTAWFVVLTPTPPK